MQYITLIHSREDEEGWERQPINRSVINFYDEFITQLVESMGTTPKKAARKGETMAETALREAEGLRAKSGEKILPTQNFNNARGALHAYLANADDCITLSDWVRVRWENKRDWLIKFFVSDTLFIA